MKTNYEQHLDMEDVSTLLDEQHTALLGVVELTDQKADHKTIQVTVSNIMTHLELIINHLANQKTIKSKEKLKAALTGGKS